MVTVHDDLFVLVSLQLVHAILDDAHRHEFRFVDVDLLILVRFAAVDQEKIGLRVELRLDAFAVNFERDVLRLSHGLVPSAN